MNDPWCCIGDYNAILEAKDREGGNPVTDEEMQDFKGALSNDIWMTKYASKTRVLGEGVSNHSPLLITSVDKSQQNTGFRFCNMWLDDPDMPQIMLNEWKTEGDNRNMYKLVQNLKNLKGPLRRLHKDKYRDIPKKQMRPERSC
ncbi:hypothetical protein DM860_012332 [Cuscuta australis]|uniref:Endonuclease/exonuclease/phosphatase domain-containing protein n=1 Tax=Cuscuta australis TaxID=267555 RepID=A0A328DPX2_9ASTE|nr:hypothetical protein DM860_012332 [Cuscuta australis]